MDKQNPLLFLLLNMLRKKLKNKLKKKRKVVILKLDKKQEFERKKILTADLYIYIFFCSNCEQFLLF